MIASTPIKKSGISPGLSLNKPIPPTILQFVWKFVDVQGRGEARAIDFRSASENGPKPYNTEMKTFVLLAQRISIDTGSNCKKIFSACLNSNRNTVLA